MRQSMRIRPAGAGDAEGRLVPGRPSPLVTILAALLVGLSVGLLALAASAQRAAEAWRAESVHAATLTIIAEEAEIEDQARTALAILQETDGIAGIRFLEPAEQRALLAPWLGTEIAFDDLLMPVMIDVTVDPARLDPEALGQRLAAAAPGAVFEDHGAWQLPRAAAAERLAQVAALAALLPLLALGAAASLAGRAAATGARGSIDLLLDLGFSEKQVARILGARLARRLLLGAVIGGVAAVVVLLWLEPPAATPGPGAGFAGWSWALVPLAIMAGAAIARLGAALAIRRSLGQRHGAG
jgi:cell division transport system permease protein